MKDVGDRGLAGPVLSHEEDGRAHRGELLHLLDQLLDLGALSDQASVDVGGLQAGVGVRRRPLGLDLAELDPALEGRDQLVHAERLLEVVERAVLERLDGALRARVRRHDDRHVVGIVGLQLLQQRDPIHRLHVDVGQDHVELLGLVARQPLLPVGRKCGLVAGRLNDRL
jgi:hypothetical protein